MTTRTLAQVFDSPITVLMGHAGTGKTNTALGIALALSAEGHAVTLADLDVVNPYFRSSDYPELLEQAHARLIAPVLARTTLDTPSLTGELDVVIERLASSSNERLIIDLGGDDDGAITIGRWSGRLREAGAHVLYVVSAYRALTTEPADAAAMLPDIEWNARLSAHAVLNVSNLGDETTLEHVRHGRAFAHETARLLGLPVEATIVPAVALPATERPSRAVLAGPSVTKALTDAVPEAEPIVLMPRFVRTPWDS